MLDVLWVSEILLSGINLFPPFSEGIRDNFLTSIALSVKMPTISYSSVCDDQSQNPFCLSVLWISDTQMVRTMSWMPGVEHLR